MVLDFDGGGSDNRAVSEAAHPSVYTIPPHRAFSDALVTGLLSLHGKDRLELARGIVLLPNNRAVRAVTDAFVRRSDGGLLLPRLLAIGDEELEGRIGGAIEPMEGAPVPPAMRPIERLMLLTHLIQRHIPGGEDAAEALRLAKDLARTLDQLLAEEIDPARLRTVVANTPELSLHWQASLERLQVILEYWPGVLAALGKVDLAERRNRLLDGLARRWRNSPPAGFVVAAGISTSAPAIARLMRTVAFSPRGTVVLSALDLAMPENEWDALGPHQGDEPASAGRSIETHPQFHLKRLLDRMGISRREVLRWRWGGGRDAPAARSRAIAHAMSPAQFTGKWLDLKPADRRLGGVRGLELADPSEEAQAIALALREALEVPGKTAALVTPDRGLARRVAAHLRRWNIEADDSAGRALSETPPGTLLLGLATVAAERFAPVPLLSLLKHPLVNKGEGRLEWLDGARLLDLALRGPRPRAGLAGLSARLMEREPRGSDVRTEAARWWASVYPVLKPFEDLMERKEARLSQRIGALRQTASALTADEVWSGPAGRAAADLFSELEAAADRGPRNVEPSMLPRMVEEFMRDVAIRPVYGQHPRVSIWGLIEARLQQADLMIVGGLNEGSWPALPAPDPWLAPRIRRELGLPGIEARIGLAAHDFSTGLGGREVLVTRARRDARAPAVASRYWLRLEAMTGGLTRSPTHGRWASAIDRPSGPIDPAPRPQPRPPQVDRPTSISVTEVDRLKADPFAFYARKMLGLTALEPIDADPTPAWRGSAVHSVFELWMKEDNCDPSRLRERIEALMDESDAHPLMRALWKPRLVEAVGWAAAEVERNRKEGRRPLLAEARGVCRIDGIELFGIADRIDKLADGSLAIVDYKTGRAPSVRAVQEGFAMQLGLLGLIAEKGGFSGVEGDVALFEYWSLARGKESLGYVASPVGGRSGIDPAEFTHKAETNFVSAARSWLTGEAPFTAKLNPTYAPYSEYDQLMRLDEWYGRDEPREHGRKSRNAAPTRSVVMAQQSEERGDA